MFEDLRSASPPPPPAIEGPVTDYLFPEFAPQEPGPAPAEPLAPPPEPTEAGAAPAQPAAEASAAPQEVLDWKDRLRQDFEAWLQAIDEIPAPDEDTEPPPAELPDLYSFYQQLVVANSESRKANRRTAEAFSQWGETLARFEAGLTPLRETTAKLAMAQAADKGLSPKYCLVLVEFMDRMRRLAAAFDAPPAKRPWWTGSDRAWRRVWEGQQQGFAILISHFDEWLKREQVVRLEVLGRPFDPTQMTAVAVEPGASGTEQAVLEEIAPGYRHRGELLRPAQVKVSAGLRKV